MAEFQEAGIGGVDLYLASFGPALQVFSENWPLRRGRPIQKPRELALFPDEEFDPYAVWPEDALDAARREVKRWRMEQLATVKRQHHLDPLTEWYILAWDAFKAPRFPVDEALKLARVVGLDFDQEIKNVVGEVKSSDVVLWDSTVRKAKGKLGPMGDTCMLNTLHQAASIVREKNTGASKKAIEDNGLLDDATLLTTLEALLNVLPAVASPEKAPKLEAHLAAASSDFDALEKLRKLALPNRFPNPPSSCSFPSPRPKTTTRVATTGRRRPWTPDDIPLLPAHTWETSYRHEDGDLIRLFYVPALSCAVQYDRTTGYFSADALVLAARGIERLIANGGKMRLIVGCTLDVDEIEAVERGYDLREQVEKKLASIDLTPPDPRDRYGLEALAWMVAKRVSRHQGRDTHQRPGRADRAPRHLSREGGNHHRPRG